MEERIPFGPRRYLLMALFFGAGGIGFIVWSGTVDHPMFVFPLGTVGAETASMWLCLVGVASLVYLSAISYIRFVRRPAVVLGADEVRIPIGEFGSTLVALARADRPRLTIERRAGGWRTCRIEHRGGTLALRSSMLPSEEAFERICDRLRELGG